ncbi:hypothetical protein CAPTEDRAFT_196219 [Capitella teleta]|uniref:Uncharacterized protein n=1 Tax=Capitella teleta TaxID=283909 RepID=R7U0W1_CAPTE|nr:hypothetical protein CAPTEDRAFT_196219 [Capitella teleta]|eukprot:ELT99522.1 hypothetical protein CAPTEDRAFT_196219 [Capitella teleta]
MRSQSPTRFSIQKMFDRETELGIVFRGVLESILVSKGWDVSQLLQFGVEHSPDRLRPPLPPPPMAHHFAPNNHVPHSPHMNMDNNNQDAMNSAAAGVGRGFIMPPPTNVMPMRNQLSIPQQDLTPQQSPTVSYSSGGPAPQIFQFSEAHFKNANALAFSNSNQSPHAITSPQTVPLNMNKPEENMQQQQFTIKTEDGRVVKLTAADIQAGLLNSDNRFHTSTPAKEHVTDAMLGAIQYNDGEMLQDSGFDVHGAIDESILSQVTGGHQGAMNLFGDADGSMANDYSMESQLSPQNFGDSSGSFNMASIDQDSASSDLST